MEDRRYIVSSLHLGATRDKVKEVMEAIKNEVIFQPKAVRMLNTLSEVCEALAPDITPDELVPYGDMDGQGAFMEECIKAHMAAFEEWPHGMATASWTDRKGNLCIRYSGGRCWHYRLTDSGDIIWW